MNIFRLAGDMTHLISIVVLLLKIHTIRSCRGAATRLVGSAQTSVFELCTIACVAGMGACFDAHTAVSGRNISEDAGAVCAGLRLPVPGLVHALCVAVRPQLT